MFMQRLITSLILIPLVLCTLFYAPAWIFGAVLVVILLACTYECLKLIPVEKLQNQILFGVLMLLSFWGSFYFFNYWMLTGLVLWLFICIAVLGFPHSQKYWGYPWIISITSLLVLPLFIQSMIHVYYFPQGKLLLIYVLFLIWATDIGAYLFGKLWGKHKLIPQVSPGKSWEGVLGGVILAMMIAGAGFAYFKPQSSLVWFAWSLATIIISIFGDLFISILKRRCHLKDTGSIIPGHGGILDRLDSLIAAFPLFYFGLIYMPLGI